MTPVFCAMPKCALFLLNESDLVCPLHWEELPEDMQESLRAARKHHEDYMEYVIDYLSQEVV